MHRIWEVLLVATRLGLTSFGGPIAHIGYFRDEYVTRRSWLNDARFGELVALCQFLPGPASSQLGIAIGLQRAGHAGALAAWLGFTLPSAAVLILFAYGLQEIGGQGGEWISGLKIVVVAVVAHALWGMGKSLAPDKPRITIAVLAAVVLLFVGGIAAQVAVIAGGGVLGLVHLRTDGQRPPEVVGRPSGLGLALAGLATFFALLVALPVASWLTGNELLMLIERFFRSGSLVFGGGHVVLPLLQAEVVQPGWVTGDEFIAGYGAAQAIPGPLFTFSAYLGTVLELTAPRWLGGIVALVAIFLPSFLLVLGVLPLWDRVRTLIPVQKALLGVNAAVVGVLLAALYDPIWTSAIKGPSDFALAAAAFALLAFWKAPPWAVVLATAATGWLIGWIG